MSRLAAISNALFYPTPVKEIQKYFEKHIYLKNGYKNRFTVLDPCCGTGDQLSAIRDILLPKATSYGRKVETVGIEIDSTRAEMARSLIETGGRRKVDHVHHGSFEDFEIHGHPSILFLNPPYDDNGMGGRTEIDWIDATAPYMTSGYGMMMLVLPDRFFLGGQNHNDLRMCLWRNRLTFCTGSIKGALKFCPEEYKSFKQSILCVERNYGNVSLLDQIAIVGTIGEYNGKIECELDSDYGDTVKAIDVRPAPKKFYESIMAGDLTAFVGTPQKQTFIKPLVPIRDEILAAVVAGGLFSGIQIDHRLVRGGITIKNETITKDSEDKLSQTTEIIPRMIATLAVLDLKTGLIDSVQSGMPSFDELLLELSPLLTEVVRTSNPSTFKLETMQKYLDRYKWLHSPRKLAGQPDGLLPAQNVATASIYRCWEMYKACILLGEMGVGKTLISIAAAGGFAANREIDNQKVVVLLPAKQDLVDKWKLEILASCREKNPKVFVVKTISDVQEAFAATGLTFILITETMAKRTSGANDIYMKAHYHFSGYKAKSICVLSKKDKMPRKHHDSKCFHCGKESKLVNSKGEIPEKEGEILYCSECKTCYKTYVRDKNGNAYASIAKYVEKHYSRKYVLVMDEAHYYKGGDSARGYAAHNFIKAAIRVLIMTGTFYNGYASSMYYNLYRSDAEFREEYGYEDVKAFVRLYGLEKQVEVTRRDSERDSWSGYGNKVNTRTSEIPGIHPSMIATMLKNTVFLNMKDMDISMPPKAERVLFVDLATEPTKKVNEYLDKVKSEAVKMAKQRPPDMTLLGQYQWAKSGAWDTFPIGDYVDGHKLAVEHPHITPKEEALLRIVSMEKADGYPTLVYYTQTERRPITGRLQRQFEEYGMKLVCMPSTVNNRVDFINKSIAEGADAIICNPQIVREGIDLLMFKHIVWYGCSNDPILVEQANRRIWRIGQTMECRFTYLGYNGTYQSEVWHTTSKKVAGMQAMHGNVSSGLAAILGDNSLIVQIQEATIAYEKRDSDLKLEDLPPVTNWLEVVLMAKKNEPIFVAKVEPLILELVEETPPPSKYGLIMRKVRRSNEEVGQFSMF